MKLKEYLNEKKVLYMIDPTTNVKDSMLDGFTYEDIIDAVYHNEKNIDEKAIKKVFKEILKDQIKDAEYALKKNISNMLEILKDYK